MTSVVFPLAALYMYLKFLNIVYLTGLTRSWLYIRESVESVRF